MPHMAKHCADLALRVRYSPFRTLHLQKRDQPFRPDYGQVRPSRDHAVLLHAPATDHAALGRARKIRGTISGFPDLTVISSDGRTGFLEVKTPNAKPRNAKDAAHWKRQAETQEMLCRMGHNVAVVRSQDEAVATLQSWGWDVK